MQPSLLAATLLLIAAAQAPRPVFEAASVKPNTAQSGLVRVSTFPNRFSAVNATVRMLVRYAYNLQDYRITGAPNWIDADRFDIEATAGSTGGSFDAVRAMTRTLLEDRFRLRTRMETRDQPIYVLAVVRRDGRLGQQIKPSGSECLPITPPAGAPPPPPPPPGGPAQGAPQCPSLLAPWAISGRQMTIERLIDVLSQRVGRRVVDKTNLTGPFDLDLQWTPDQIPGSDRGLPPPPIDPNGPALFTALQEQLGLKLDSQRGPVDMLVIDEVSKPSAD